MPGVKQSFVVSNISNTSLEPSSTTTDQKDRSKDDSTTYPQGLPPQSSTSRPSPAQAIRDHYQALNNREYELTWNNLSPQFKAESGKSLVLSRREYEDWWNSVSNINLQQADTLQINNGGSKAIVNYHISYTMNHGKTVQDKHKRIFLIWDNKKGKWLIDRRD